MPRISTTTIDRLIETCELSGMTNAQIEAFVKAYIKKAAK